MSVKLYSVMIGVVGGLFSFLQIASAQGQIVVNEIAWMGTVASANDEWIELYNPTSDDISLEGWTLVALDGAPNISLSGAITAGSYFILERTDDSTIADVSADLIYTGALGNGGEDLELRDANGTVVDSVTGWSRGDSATKSSMELGSSGWHTNDGVTTHGTDALGGTILGTPGAPNSAGLVEAPSDEEENENDPISSEPEESLPENPVDTDSPEVEAEQILLDIPSIAQANQSISFRVFTESGEVDSASWNFGNGMVSSELYPTHSYQFAGSYVVSVSAIVDGVEYREQSIIQIIAGDIVISEFMPNPVGKDEENEWIEIGNQSSQPVDLGGWKLDDIADGGSKPFVFPHGTVVLANSYIAFGRSATKITLNNEVDEVRLLSSTGIVIDIVRYDDGVKEGFSAARKGSAVYWTQSPTPGSANVVFIDSGVGSISEAVTEHVREYAAGIGGPLLKSFVKLVQPAPIRNISSVIAVPHVYAVEIPTEEQMDVHLRGDEYDIESNAMPDSRKSKSASSELFGTVARVFGEGELILLISLVASSGLFAASIALRKKKTKK